MICASNQGRTLGSHQQFFDALKSSHLCASAEEDKTSLGSAVLLTRPRPP